MMMSSRERGKYSVWCSHSRYPRADVGISTTNSGAPPILKSMTNDEAGPLLCSILPLPIANRTLGRVVHVIDN